MVAQPPAASGTHAGHAASGSVSPVAPVDLSSPRRVHVVGVGGPGMSAIAVALAEMGHHVSGSDIREQPSLERVRAAGVDVFVGHDAAHVHGCDAITASSIIPASNVELQEAAALAIPVLRRAGALASICALRKSLAVAGTHGKTTTSSMLMLIIAAAGLRPNFVIGGDVADVGTGAEWTGGEWFVVEADESDGTHAELPLYGTIVTNVEVDHLDHFGTFDNLVASFDAYLAAIAGPKVIGIDGPVCARLASRHDVITYGLSADAEVRAVDLQPGLGSFRFAIERRGERIVELELPQRGVHNVVNATGAAAMAMAIGIEAGPITSALQRFGGIARRFDVRGVDAGATFVDDYAHLPTEIAATLAAARQSGDPWTRVVAVFQPNRFHRIADMWPDYADAFVDADVVVITDVYASGTTPIPGVTGRLIVNAVEEAHPEARIVYLARRSDLVSFIAGEVVSGDVCVSMGCGDIGLFPEEVLARRQALRCT